MFAFVARAADAGEEFGVVTVGVSEWPDGHGRVLLFMSPLPGDAETTLCVTDDAAEVAYGAVDGIRLARSSMRIRFRGGAGAVFGLPDDAEIRLELSDADFEALVSGLSDVVARCSEAPALRIDPE